MFSFHSHINGRLIAAAAMALLFASGNSASGQSSYSERTSPLPPEQVFLVSANSGDNTARFIYKMPPEFYLYRERFLVSIIDDNATNNVTDNVQLSDVQFPPAQTYDDPFFGRTEIYRDGVIIQAATIGSGEFSLRVISQGCDEKLGICYPPQVHTAKMHTRGGKAEVLHMSSIDLPKEDSSDSLVQESEAQSKSESESESVTTNGDDESAAAAQILANRNLWQVLITFFGFGLLLSFTPCVLPMLPILLGIISGGKSGRDGDKADNKKSAAVLTLAYISGVCIAYTALGVAAGLSGQLFLPYLQSPPALIFTASIFILLSLSMFGWFEIQMPARLRNIGGGGRGGSVGGAIAMGALSAAIVSPCVAAPLIGALIYIGSSGDAVLGGAALLSLSLGMSALLAAAGIGGMALPRGGAWMKNIRQLSGVLLLAVAVWVISVLLPAATVVFLYGALCILGGVLLNIVPSESSESSEPPTSSQFPKLQKRPPAIRAISLVLLLWGSIMLIGAAGGARDPLSPLSVFRGNSVTSATPLSFTPVQTIAQTQQHLTQNKRAGILEFYADWCVSCKEMERFTFADSRVQARLSTITLLRADVTESTAESLALMKAFNVYGPPAIIFFAEDGKVITNVRVNGYQSAERFLQALTAAGIDSPPALK